MYALVDGNNFYVSCERVFMPRLSNRPVVVLSNNDGCAIARSNEAKAMGIKMGAPWFQIKHLEEEGLVALSANFELYGDMSDRMMSLAAELGHRQEIYSIDESFVDVSGIREDLVERARRIRHKVLQGTGIPTCIGIGPTKTLAKLGNHIAKTAERKPGSYPAHLAQVCNLGAMSQDELQQVLATTEVEEVWGVGPRIGKQLQAAGIKTVLDLNRLDPATVRSRWSVVLERTLRELQGTPCVDLEDVPTAKQQIACTRSFGQAVTDKADLVEALTTFASRAAEKLRRQNGHAASVLVFIRTSPFRPDPQYSRSLVVPLRRPTADSGLIVQAALLGLEAIYRPGFKYAKAGVMLLNLQQAGLTQGELELEVEPDADRSRLMAAMDAINQRYGRGAVHLASAGGQDVPKRWGMRQERRTGRYTTRLEDLLMAAA